MERVTGIGGFFFRSRDPDGLAGWYRDRFGIEPVPKSYGGTPWRQQEGITVFAPFPQDSEMIGPPEKTWMINFRVDDLDVLLDKLRGEGVTVDPNVQDSEYGKFGWIMDPDGNRVELWQPPAA